MSSSTFSRAEIHAREWISSAQCTYIINELTTNSKKYEPLLRDVKFHIIPIVNPDGFAFSHTDSRYWRKNRRPHQDPACVGVDLNRNFPFHWNEVGGDSYACSEIYVGPSACSEPECQAVKKFMDKRMDEIDTYITMHSYGQVCSASSTFFVQLYPQDFVLCHRFFWLLGAITARLLRIRTKL